MIEQILLGIIQGIAEWLPVSSEGLIILAKTNWFGHGSSLEDMVKHALFLHLGTFLAAAIYFRHDVKVLLETLFSYKSSNRENQKLFVFLALSTVISGLLGLLLLKVLTTFSDQLASKSQFITLLVGILLLVTAYLEFKAQKGGYKNITDLKLLDGIILGIAQGFAALPGLSRSGLTVSALLLRKFDRAHALKLSFLMSLPIVLAGNIILNLEALQWSTEAFVGLFFSFLFGLATIHGLLKIAQKINFGYFVLLFGIITILSTRI